jgi:hypothetical protein
MLQLYDHLDKLLESRQSSNATPPVYPHMISDVMNRLGYCDEKDLHDALMRAFEICCVLQIPITDNFKKVYRYHDHEVEVDWQVSDLGCYLLLINGNTCNPNVARAQLLAMIASRKNR